MDVGGTEIRAFLLNSLDQRGNLQGNAARQCGGRHVFYIAQLHSRLLHLFPCGFAYVLPAVERPGSLGEGYARTQGHVLQVDHVCPPLSSKSFRTAFKRQPAQCPVV